MQLIDFKGNHIDMFFACVHAKFLLNVHSIRINWIFFVSSSRGSTAGSSLNSAFLDSAIKSRNDEYYIFPQVLCLPKVCRVPRFLSWRPIIYSLLILGCVAISACSSLQTTTYQQNYHYLSWQERLHQLKNINSWNITGAISVQHGNDVDTAHYTWLQKKDSYALTLSGPLNLGSIYINGNSQEVTLIKSQKEKYSAKTPEELLQKTLGWSLPISGLAYWIKGMPSPKTPYSLKLDSFNHLAYLKQQGWSIQYQDFMVQNGVDLPRKIALQKAGLRIKIVVK
ncbi:MAG: lipoprotein insertase outer membrane protein LolB [Gammaproteobacteria bacterium]